MERSAFQEAADLYRLYQVDGDFFSEVADHLQTGIVFSSPHYFLMAKAVALDDGRAAWFVTAAVGDLRQLLALAPWPMPFIAFCRRGRSTPKVYPFDQFIRKAALC